jgi:hypothetical protein
MNIAIDTPLLAAGLFITLSTEIDSIWSPVTWRTTNTKNAHGRPDFQAIETLTGVHWPTISQILASPEGEGFF